MLTFTGSDIANTSSVNGLPSKSLVPLMSLKSLTSPITAINSRFPVEMSGFSILDDDSVLSICFSPCGGLLAGISTAGHVKVWQIVPDEKCDSWPLLRVLADAGEAEAIEEYFTGAFLPNSRHFVVAGKRRDRHRWDEKTGDNRALPGVVKVFDLITGQCVDRLFADAAAADEILFLQPISSPQHGNFLFTAGQDGRLVRWPCDCNWKVLEKEKKARKLGDLVFHFDRISDELLAVAVDNTLQIVNAFTLQTIRTFKTGFTSYCDFVRVLQRDAFKIQVLLRGVELLNVDTLEPSKSNSLIVCEFDLKSRGGRIVRRFQHPQYCANSWLIKLGLTVNQDYIAAPTITGRILVFNRQTAQCTAILHAHDNSEVRQVIFHESLPIMASCGDDGRIRIYFSTEIK